MKKILALFLTIQVLLSFAANADEVLTIEKEPSEIKVILNDEELSFDAPPQIINGRTMVPMRKLFEALSCTVSWDDETKTASAESADGTKLEFTSGTPALTVTDASGKSDIKELDVAPQIVDSRTLIPLRAISESLNADVSWSDFGERKVMIRQETEIDINEPDVQKIYDGAQSGNVFMCYGAYGEGMYVDSEMLDIENFNWMSDLYRNLICMLCLKDEMKNEFSREEAGKIITDFFSGFELEEDGSYSAQISPDDVVALIDGSVLEGYSDKLFGKPLINKQSYAIPIGYAAFFFYARNNIVNIISKDTPALKCNVLYNKASDKYLFLKENTFAAQYTAYNQSSKLLKASKYHDEISVWVYHETDYDEYDGNKRSVYKGVYKNTYKKDGDNYIWLGSNCVEETIEPVE